MADWLTKDWFMTLADFSAYMDIQSEIEALYADELEWNRKALLNVANSGYFSSDRSMEDYLERIWHTAPLACRPTGSPPGFPLNGSAYLAHCSSGLTAAGA